MTQAATTLTRAGRCRREARRADSQAWGKRAIVKHPVQCPAVIAPYGLRVTNTFAVSWETVNRGGLYAPRVRIVVASIRS